MSDLERIERLLREKSWQLDCVAIQVETLRWIARQEEREHERTAQVFAMFIVTGIIAFVMSWLAVQTL
jgi:hypothetical protein